MGMDDKLRNEAENLEGKAKEATGRATDNRSLEGEGRLDQDKADMKQAGEKVKDVFRD